mmetsp:Transcript_23761/g.36665  ORF Transcript_23761/g.36665 Transcript_23761/m.36665 type:complete len:95 (+) Transcript_23761:1421-1705(+)
MEEPLLYMESSKVVMVASLLFTGLLALVLERTCSMVVILVRGAQTGTMATSMHINLLGSGTSRIKCRTSDGFIPCMFTKLNDISRRYCDCHESS